MIKTNINKLQVPDKYVECTHKHKIKLHKLLSSSMDKREVFRRRLDTNCLKIIRDDILKLFHYKCAYCETLIRGTGVNLDSFRPKSKYPFLIHEVNNILPACSICNKSKSNHFPLKYEIRQDIIIDPIINEEYLLINPYMDNPLEHFSFQEDGLIIPKSEIGNITIQTINLNRPALVEARLQSLNTFIQLIEELKQLESINEKSSVINNLIKFKKDNIKKNLHSSSEFSAFKNQYYLNNKNTDIKSATLENTKYVNKPSFNKFWISKVIIENFKTIEYLEIVFENDIDVEKIAIFLGENGVGKSSVLEAISLALASDSIRTKYIDDASTLLNKYSDKKEGSIILYFFQQSKPFRLRFFNNNKAFKTDNQNFDIPTLAYGANRLHTSENKEQPKALSINIESLFNPWKTLVNANSWLGDHRIIDEENFFKITSSLRIILDLNDNEEIHRDGNSIFIISQNEKINFNDYSTGYKNIITLIIDIIYNLTQNTYDIEYAEGIVLIDEIENHLHPKWKIQIITKLRNIFPKIRFILTTHDPLCIQNTFDGEVYYLSVDKNTKDFSYSQINVPKGLNIDQLLTGEWFGMIATVDTDTIKLLNEHSKLIITRKTKKIINRIQDIENELRNRFGNFSETSIEKIALQEAQKILDKQYQKITHDDRNKIRNRLQNILNKKLSN